MMDGEDVTLRTVICRFERTGGLKIGVIGEPQNYSVFAKMVEVNDPGKYHPVPLGKVVDEFKKMNT